MALIQYLSRIHFEFGAVSVLGREISRLGISRPLVVTDKGVVSAGILDRALDAALPFAPELYDGTTENPTEDSLLECLEIWHERDCDGLIALGGGSPTDLSKAVALIASHGGKLADYSVKSGGSDQIGRVVPQIAVPTAAGTGAEVGRACVMTLQDGTKSVAVNLNMVAGTVLCDPELTFSLSPRLTAATGIDALSHGIETILSTRENPPAEAIAFDCVARAAKWLPRAVEDGGDRRARWEMMMAALEGGMCLQKSLGGAHAMAAPLGELDLHHGTLIGVLLPHVLRFNGQVVNEKLKRIQTVVGIDCKTAMHDWMQRFVSQVGLPIRLSELGVRAEALPEIARKAAADHLNETNPRRASADDYLELLESAL